jgi:sugar lactone lactonase YvrE
MKNPASLARGAAMAALTVLLAAASLHVEAQPHITYTHVTVAAGFQVAGFTVDTAGNAYATTNRDSSMLYKETLANGAYTQTPIATAAVSPVGIAVDSAGNLYVADAGNSTILKETYANGAYTESTVVSGLNEPYALTIDGAGNLYVSTVGDGHVYKETLSNGAYTQSLIATSALASAQAIAVDSAGNLYIADAGNNRALKETLQGGTYTESVIASGLNQPLGIAVNSNGTVYIDDTNNYRLLMETPQAGGYTQSVSNAAPQGGNGLAFDGSGNLYYAETQSISKAIANELAEAPFTAFAATPVAAVPITQTVTFTFDVGGALGSTPFSVSTQGSSTLDFRAGNQGGSACASGTPYATGATCTVAVAFSPTRPGARYGAVVLYGPSGNPIATGYLQGSGSSPQVSFSPGVTFGNIAAVDVGPNYVAADGIGDILYTGNFGITVQNFESHTALYTFGPTDTGSSGLPVDGAGNVFDANEDVTEYQFNPYYVGNGQTPYVSGTTLGSGGSFGEPGGAAVDGAGNVYFTDPINNALYVATFSGGGYDTTSIGSGLSGATALAVDGAGSVYVADTGNNRILKESLANGVYTQSVLVTGITAPSAIAVDGMGNLYIPQANSVLKETLVNGTYTAGTESPFTGISSIAVDPSGNVYLNECGLENCDIEVIDISDAPSLNFASTAVGSVSSDSPQTITVVNNGNAPLTFSAPGATAPITAGFTLSANSTCPVLPGSSQSLTLAVGASCTLLVSFAPTTSGGVTGTLTLTDNALNASGATQVIHLNGTGTGSGGGGPPPTPQVTLTPASNDYGSVSVGATASATFVLANTGNVAVNIASTSLPSTVFTVTSTTCGASLAVAASCNYVVTFAPVAAGAQTSTFSVTDDAGTQSAALSGNGAAASAPQAVLSPASADFGSVGVGASSAAQTFDLSNAGNAALAISDVSLSGANAAEFAIASNDCGESLGAGASCTITVTFSPSAAGTATATLSVADNAASAAQSAALTGTGTAADFALTASPSTQTASAGSSVDYTINVASVNGSFDQGVALTAGDLPPGASVSFSPATVTPGSAGATSTMTILTAPLAAVNRHPSIALPLGAPMLAVLLVVPFRKRRGTRLIGVLAITIALASLPGCGGGFALPQKAAGVTTYTITISGTAGSIQHSTSVQLLLQ